MEGQLCYVNNDVDTSCPQVLAISTKYTVVSDKMQQQKTVMSKNAVEDVFDVFYSVSKPKLKQELDVQQQTPPEAFEVRDGQIIEHGAVINRHKFYYNSGICKEDGELFGIQYNQLWPGITRVHAQPVNWFQSSKRRSLAQIIQFEQPSNQISKCPGCISQKPEKSVFELESCLKQFNALNTSTDQSDTISVIQTSVDRYIQAQRFGLGNFALKSQNAAAALKLHVQRAKQAVPAYLMKQKAAQSKDGQQSAESAASSAQEQQKKQEKFLFGLQYTPNYDIPVLSGFTVAGSFQLLDSLKICPTLCHFIVCLLAHQDTNALLGDTEVFLGQKTRHDITKHRQSASVLHILNALRDRYPGATALIPKNVSIFEAVLSALNLMVSPGSFQLRNSALDAKAGEPEDVDAENLKYEEKLQYSDVQKRLLWQKKESAYVADREAFLEELRKLKEEKQKKQEIKTLQCFPTQIKSTTQKTPKSNYSISAMQQQQALLLKSIQQAKSAAQSNLQSSVQNIAVQQFPHIPVQIPQIRQENVEMQSKQRDQAFNALKQLKCCPFLSNIDEQTLSYIISHSKHAKQLGQVKFLVDKVCNQPETLSVYVSQNELVLVDFDGEKHQIYPLDFNYEDLAQLQVSNMFHAKTAAENALQVKQETKASKAKPESAQNAEKITQKSLFDDLHRETSEGLLYLVSPLLGEYELRYEPLQDVRKEPNLYFGVNLSLLNKVSAVLNKILLVISEEVQVVQSGKLEQFNCLSGSYDQTNLPASSGSRKAVLNAQKARVALTIPHPTNLEIETFRAQEWLRFSIFSQNPFIYCINGKVTYVAAPLKTADGRQRVHSAQSAQNALNQTNLNKLDQLGEDKETENNTSIDVPVQTTRGQLLQEAVARLPGGFGTREDICVLLTMSSLVDKSDPRLVPRVSQALERLKAQKLASCDNREWKFRLQRCLVKNETGKWPESYEDIV